VYIRYLRSGNHYIYGLIRCISTVLANPKYATFIGTNEGSLFGPLLCFPASNAHLPATIPFLTCIHMVRIGQNHIYTVYIRYFWQGYHQIYGHIRCIYTVLANPTYGSGQPVLANPTYAALQARSTPKHHHVTFVTNHQ
jgi:hypothetical protein